MWNKIRDRIRSITNNSDDYEEKYMKIKFKSDVDPPLKKTVGFRDIVIVVGSVFLLMQQILPAKFS